VYSRNEVSDGESHLKRTFYGLAIIVYIPAPISFAINLQRLNTVNFPL
jgi:hypothetical protein